MAKKLGMVLMVGGLSLTALAGAAAITASTSIATSLPRPDAPNDVTLAQAAKPVPPAPPARREENGPDGGSIGGKRVTPPTPAPQDAAAPGEPTSAPGPRRDIRVETRDANVRVNPNNGRVRVDAPYTFVDVNPDRGRAVIRAPGVNLDIRW